MGRLYHTLASLAIPRREVEGVSPDGERGIPLLYLNPPSFSREEWLKAAGQVAAVVAEYRPDWREEAERVKLCLERSRLQWGDFLPALLRQEEKAVLRFLNFLSRHRLDKEVAGFIFHHALKLCLRGYASSFRPQDFKDWQRGSCPVCGRYPHLARLKGKEGRLLYCSLCEAAWPYPRLGCPFCGHSSPEGEELLAWEGTPYRVYLYSCCGSYLKAVVETGAVDRPFDPVKVEGETLPLDLAAWREGFSPVALSLFPAFTFERGLRERR